MSDDPMYEVYEKSKIPGIDKEDFPVQFGVLDLAEINRRQKIAELYEKIAIARIANGFTMDHVDQDRCLRHAERIYQVKQQIMMENPEIKDLGPI